MMHVNSTLTDRRMKTFVRTSRGGRGGEVLEGDQLIHEIT